MKILFALLSLFCLTAWAADTEFALVIRDHRFTPAEIRVPTGQKIKLIVHNQDATPEEFESHELNREKVIAPGTKATIYVGPLKPGRYSFIGEFHEKTARGVIIAE
jgi:heme/copper-type cytochrome/quinol oxidase subunit 2